MGHIELAAPVVHIWYLRGTRSWLAYLLMGTEAREELKAKQLEKVIYFAANLVTWVDEEQASRGPARPRGRAGRGDRRHRAPAATSRSTAGSRPSRTSWPSSRPRGPRTPRSRPASGCRRRRSRSVRERSEDEIDLAKRALDEFRDLHARKIIEDELLWRELQDPLRRLLRGRHGRRGHPAAHRPDRPRRRGDQAPRGDRRRRRAPAAVGPAPPEGHQAAEDRHRLQPPRRPRPAGQRPPGHDPRGRPGHPARPAPDGPARRWPVRHLGPERPLPPGHQPQQPAEAAARPGRARDHHQQREADAPGGRRRPVRQRPAWPAGDRARATGP